MRLSRLLTPELILLEMETRPSPEDEGDDVSSRAKRILAEKERVLGELVELLARSGRIANRRKLLTDLVGREKKASTGLEVGIAVPHVRSRQAKEFVFAFARSTPGVEFDCRDGRPAHLFFVLVAPPSEDRMYLRIYRKLAEAFSFAGESLTREFLDARDEGEILRLLRSMD